MIRKAFTSQLFWLSVFGVWALILSGVPALWIGSPGAIQSVSLHRMLEQKQRQQLALQDSLERLETDIEQLQKNRAVQQREIRRVLGYAAPDELIFDFSAEGDGGGL